MTAFEKLNRLAKWRSIFAGWQLGTRVKGDPESDAVRDHREATIILRAEVTAITRLLMEYDSGFAARFNEVLGEEADALSEAYARRFPGMTATEDGIHMEFPAAGETMKGWRP
jgi:hypothetical protein